MKRWSEGRHVGTTTLNSSNSHSTSMRLRTAQLADSSVRSLYKNCADCIRRIEQQSAAGGGETQAVFTNELITLRNKLRSCSEKLMFLNPAEFARKAEEIIWRKCFYEPVQACRQKKDAQDQASVELLILSGMGYYRSLILKLQHEYGLVFPPRCVDFSDETLHEGDMDKKQVEVHEKNKDWAIVAVHRSLIYIGDLARYHIDLTGDDSDLAERHYIQAALLRPKAGMPHNQLGTRAGGTNYGVDAVYHYMRCLACEETFDGAESNLKQLLSRNEKAVLNLTPSSSPVRKCLVKFLRQVAIFFRDDSEYNSGDTLSTLCQELLSDFEICLYLLRDDTPALSSQIILKLAVTELLLIKRLQDDGSFKLSAGIALVLSLLSHLLSYISQHMDRSLELTNVKTAAESSNDATPPPQNDSVVTGEMKKEKESVETGVENGTDGQDGNNNEPPTKPTPVKPKRRMGDLLRPRRRKSTTAEDTESEEEDVTSDEDDDVIDDDHEIETDNPSGSPTEEKENKTPLPEQEAAVDSHSPSADEPPPVQNGIETDPPSVASTSSLPNDGEQGKEGQDAAGVDVMTDKDVVAKQDLGESAKQPWSNLTLSQRLAELTDDLGGVMGVVKVLLDWLRCSPNLIVSMAEGSQSLWTRLAEVLNKLPNEDVLIDLVTSDDSLSVRLQGQVWTPIADWTQQRPLAEDVTLVGLGPLGQVHGSLQWNAPPLSESVDETIVRLFCLRSFGHYLLRLNTPGLKYDRARHEFMVPATGKKTTVDHHSVSATKTAEDRVRLSKNLGRLHLQNELGQMQRRQWLPVYVVVDTSALSNKLPVVRNLVMASKFVIVVPNGVIAELDRLKKDSGAVRDAIRWLESEFMKGNRYLRSQKDSETADLDCFDDDDLKDLVPLMECCVALAGSFGGTTSAPGTKVAILTSHTKGSGPMERLQRALKLTTVDGVVVENIHKFYNRWQAFRKKGG